MDSKLFQAAGKKCDERIPRRRGGRGYQLGFAAESVSHPGGCDDSAGALDGQSYFEFESANGRPGKSGRKRTTPAVGSAASADSMGCGAVSDGRPGNEGRLLRSVRHAGDSQGN